jgi:CRP/FNR family transcriptional regulator
MSLDRTAIGRVLKAAPLFAALTEVEIELLSRRTGARAYSPGELLFSEGEPCAGLYMIASGRVRIFKISPSGREHVLAIEGPGSSIRCLMSNTERNIFGSPRRLIRGGRSEA